MRNDKIITGWDKMNPDSVTKERILRNLQGVLEISARHDCKRTFRRFAIGFATAFVILLGSFGTVYAASAEFRNYLHTLLFPRYDLTEMVSIGNGHMTGSFDIDDVLLTFLDKWNRFEFGNAITVAWENGYCYSLYAQDDDTVQAFVDSGDEGYCIVVFIERVEYRDTEGIWQVTGYQIIENSAAETMKSQLEPCAEASLEISSAVQEDTSIKSTEDSVIFYNVNEKNNRVSLDIEEDDGQILRHILEGCDRFEHIRGGLFQYVIQINDSSYMFDSNGDGMVDDSGSHWGITINESDLKVIMELFEWYHMTLEETEVENQM